MPEYQQPDEKIRRASNIGCGCLLAFFILLGPVIFIPIASGLLYGAGATVDTARTAAWTLLGVGVLVCVMWLIEFREVVSEKAGQRRSSRWRFPLITRSARSAVAVAPREPLLTLLLAHAAHAARHKPTDRGQDSENYKAFGHGFGSGSSSGRSPSRSRIARTSSSMRRVLTCRLSKALVDLGQPLGDLADCRAKVDHLWHAAGLYHVVPGPKGRPHMQQSRGGG